LSIMQGVAAGQKVCVNVSHVIAAGVSKIQTVTVRGPR